ncbi:Uncharacterised protein [Mycobacteroides abscessus subsp. abscessus]|nr:Uncharacterised protein [Mycobacteroides abscessus subsp. abscessus]SKU09019.1 Uncharacterised protein [Mycobacteroides abscessus subsp. abscessus]
MAHASRSSRGYARESLPISTRRSASGVTIGCFGTATPLVSARYESHSGMSLFCTFGKSRNGSDTRSGASARRASQL